MADQQNYPYNVIPQVRQPAPSSQLPNLQCPVDYSSEFIVIDDNKMSVIQGYETKSFIDLTSFFINIENNFQLYEFNLKYTGDFSTYTTLDYTNIGYEDGIKFIAIFPQYQNTEIEDQDTWYLHYRYFDDPAWIADAIYGDEENTEGSPEDETTWRHLGKVLMIDSSKLRTIKQILLQNRIGSDIKLKILISY